MKKSILIVLGCTMFIAFSTHAQDLPYKAGYSSNFKLGSHDWSKMVLSLYKDYEKNDFQTHRAWFSDTATAVLPNGQVVRGIDEVINYFQKDRQTNGDVTFTMDAIIPLTSVDRKENWVALWGTSQTQQGKQEFQAIWRINKDKKVDFMKFYSAQASQ